MLIVYGTWWQTNQIITSGHLPWSVYWRQGLIDQVTATTDYFGAHDTQRLWSGITSNCALEVWERKRQSQDLNSKLKEKRTRSFYSLTPCWSRADIAENESLIPWVVQLQYMPNSQPCQVTFMKVRAFIWLERHPRIEMGTFEWIQMTLSISPMSLTCPWKHAIWWGWLCLAWTS